ncbi:MAG: hypothetical protein KAJ86_05565 [Alphaproteobacteria bacterium]|nr:hypothetical protein [Alphaproteobacteria bacterium]
MILKINKFKNRCSERGNVLFLILIAVALFAALSYAVTQSTRTGGGSGDNETALISSAQLTQYPASLRTAIVRMIIGGVNIGDLEFNTPANFSNCTTGNKYCVFHPSGGGATYATAPADMMASTGGNTAGTWYFNGENQIHLLGTSSGDETPVLANVDLIAFLPGISLTLCSRINEELGLPISPPVDGGIDYATQMINTDGSTPTGLCSACGLGETIGSDTASLDGQPFGCFIEDGGANDVYVYYHVLVER